MKEESITMKVKDLPDSIPEYYNLISPESQLQQKKDFYQNLLQHYYKAMSGKYEEITPEESRIAGFMEGMLRPTIHDSFCYNHHEEYAEGNKSGRSIHEAIGHTPVNEWKKLNEDLNQIEEIILKIYC